MSEEINIASQSQCLACPVCIQVFRAISSCLRKIDSQSIVSGKEVYCFRKGSIRACAIHARVCVSCTCLCVSMRACVWRKYTIIFFSYHVTDHGEVKNSVVCWRQWLTKVVGLIWGTNKSEGGCSMLAIPEKCVYDSTFLMKLDFNHVKTYRYNTWL